jgi:hypothetical protein
MDLTIPPRFYDGFIVHSQNSYDSCLFSTASHDETIGGDGTEEMDQCVGCGPEKMEQCGNKHHVHSGQCVNFDNDHNAEFDPSFGQECCGHYCLSPGDAGTVDVHLCPGESTPDVPLLGHRPGRRRPAAHETDLKGPPSDPPV